MRYISIYDCKNSLFTEALKFDITEQTTDYITQTEGIAKLEGILVQIQQRYYRTFFQKAAYLFLAVNKGHFFENGNKRLALVLLVTFVYQNQGQFRVVSKQRYRNWFKKNFPDYTLRRTHFRYSIGWAFYNLNKATASSADRDFDNLKKSVEDFLILTINR